MQNYITLQFEGKAVSKSNYKGISKYPSKKTGKHFPILSTEHKVYEANLKEQALKQLDATFVPFESDVWVSLTFQFKNRVHSDIANLPKSICDAMEGVLYRNDKQVWLDKVFPVYDKDKAEGFTMEVRTVELDNVVKLFNPMFIVDLNKNTIKEVGTNNIQKLKKADRKNFEV